MNPLAKKCIDINSAYCPCLLADTNHCTFCSRLQGKSTCDCDWSGVCILYEKYWQDKIKKQSMITRMTEETEALQQKEVGDRTYLLDFNISEDLAESLTKLGAFVFLRRASDPDCAHFPVGVMKMEGCRITVAIEAIGAKSARFILNQTEKIMVRGPYYNGVLGKPWIDNLTEGTVILLAGGIGQAPALPILHALAARKNKIKVILAPGKVGEIFIGEELDALDVEVISVSSMRKEGFLTFKNLIEKKIDLLVSAGPDAQHSGIIRWMNDCGVDLPMAATNNATMCCGEGICGSCHKLTQDDKSVKMCKVQLEYGQLMQE